jgi:hypothetical protein
LAMPHCFGWPWAMPPMHDSNTQTPFLKSKQVARRVARNKPWRGRARLVFGQGLLRQRYEATDDRIHTDERQLSQNALCLTGRGLPCCYPFQRRSGGARSRNRSPFFPGKPLHAPALPHTFPRASASICVHPRL